MSKSTEPDCPEFFDEALSLRFFGARPACAGVFLAALLILAASS